MTVVVEGEILLVDVVAADDAFPVVGSIDQDAGEEDPAEHHYFYLQTVEHSKKNNEQTQNQNLVSPTIPSSITSNSKHFTTFISRYSFRISLHYNLPLCKHFIK